jgi:hypothetical protein
VRRMRFIFIAKLLGDGQPPTRHIDVDRLRSGGVWHRLASTLWAVSRPSIPIAVCILTTQFAFAQVHTNPLSRSAADMERTYETLKPDLQKSAFGKPLVIESHQRGDQLQGDVYAVIDHPFSAVQTALRPPSHWCEILMLHLNTKGCAVHSSRQDDSGGPASLEVAIGGKHEEAPSDARELALDYRVATAMPSFLDIRMQAKDGPMSTHDYRLWLQATPVETDRTFVHLHYAYSFGMAAGLAMKGYLATIGRDKVGFSRSGNDPDAYVDGIRGVVERNAMRYYLAIDAYLDSLSAPPGMQREARIKAWFDATERYPQQLHEINKDEYLTMKRHELAHMPKSP